MPEIPPNAEHVTQITTAEVEDGQQEELLRLMTERARSMATQPGFISITLHRSLDGLWSILGDEVRQRPGPRQR